MRETPGTFYSLWVDNNKVLDDDVNIDGEKSFEGFKIDMKEYTFTASLPGSKNYWKGRKKLYIYSYQSKKYEGMSPKASKKVRIK